MPTIVFIGDSITEGAADYVRGGWSRRLAASLPPGWEAVQAGVGGDTIQLILARLEQDALIYAPDIVVLAVGINDSRRYGANGPYEVPLEEFRRGLAEFARRMAGHPTQVLVVGLTPLDEARTLPIAEDLYYTQVAATQYDAALEHFAAQHGYRYVALAPAFAAAGGAAALTADGLHPTPDGHALIAAAVQAGLQGWL
ncbi:MAG: SGNH/GDSL hydrolase family protein [Anaerolineales bacterium]|nr:SGNH/GDSL hydrolase family protein [Anaerolineales bacterium]